MHWRVTPGLEETYVHPFYQGFQLPIPLGSLTRLLLSMVWHRIPGINTISSRTKAVHRPPCRVVRGVYCWDRWNGCRGAIQWIPRDANRSSRVPFSGQAQRMKLTNGWSFLHCFRSSARRGRQIPDIVDLLGRLETNPPRRRRRKS